MPNEKTVKTSRTYHRDNLYKRVIEDNKYYNGITNYFDLIWAIRDSWHGQEYANNARLSNYNPNKQEYKYREYLGKVNYDIKMLKESIAKEIKIEF